jgi:type III pantothenate kinase
VTFLAIDIGNTRLKWALFETPSSQANLLAQGVCFLENVDRLAEEQWANLGAQFGDPTLILGCCVAGDALRRRTEEQLELWDTPTHWVVASAAECGVRNGYDSPTRLGADRWVAMIGARQHMLDRLQGPKYAGSPIGARPMVVVMVGTAVTVDALDTEGQFLGGLILPGHGIMLKSLQAGTAGLHVPTGSVCDFPTNTSDALTSGGTYAIAGAIERMFSALQHRCGIKPWCYVAGGAGWKMTQHIPVPHELIESLVFEGLLTLGHHRTQQN